MKRCRQCLVVARHEFADLARERSFSSWLAHSKAFRALRVLLSCVAKKVSKEGHPVGPPSTLRAAGSQACGAFPEGTSLCRPETSRIVRAALRVFAPPACLASTGTQGQDQVQLPITEFHTGFQIPVFFALHDPENPTRSGERWERHPGAMLYRQTIAAGKPLPRTRIPTVCPPASHAAPATHWFHTACAVSIRARGSHAIRWAASPGVHCHPGP